MTLPFVGEIKMVGFNFAPRNYALCNGQLVAIQSNTALFSLLGTTYGGNGTSNFGLPNMQGSAPMHIGRNQPGPGLSIYDLGQQAGTPSVTLLSTEMPMHNHQISGAVITGSTPSNTPGPTTAFTNTTPNQFYVITNTSLVLLAPQTITLTGGSQPHNNRQPYLAVTFVIALSGIFPARN